jgi:hypothetical protein
VDEELNPEWAYHRDHSLERLKPLEGTSISRDAYDSSRRTIYFLASNGRETFLITKRRTGPTEPYSYELKRGHIRRLPPAVLLREDELLRQIVWAKKGSSPTAEEIALFVDILNNSLSRIRRSDLNGEVADFHHPLISYVPPPKKFLMEAMENCRENFNEPAAGWFIDFMEAHRDSILPLGLRISRDFEIMEEVTMEETAGHREIKGLA